MKKIIVGITALSASAVSFGQIAAPTQGDQRSSVRVYGVADLGIAYYRTSGQSKTAMHSTGAGSRIGFLAGEDLGQGLRANARLEAGMNLNNGTLSSTNGNANRFWSRQAYFELESKTFGALRVGRQEGPIYSFFPRYDPMLMPSMDAWGVLTTLGAPAPGRGSGTGVSSGFLINPTGRTENTIGYISPRLGGVQAKVSYSLNEGSDTQPKLLESYVEYASGPLVAGVLYVNASSTSGAGTIRPTKSVSETAIGASYQFGPVNPYVTYIRRNLTDPTIGADGNALNNNVESVKLVGVAIPVSGRSTIRATYGRYSSGSAGRDATNYGIAYTYDLSRTVTLMAAVTRLTQGSAATWPIFVSPRPDAGNPVNGAIIGANYRF